MDNCCDALMKYLIFILNFVLFAVGCALIALGAYVKAEADDYLNFLGDAYLNTSVVFIVLGVIVLLVGFFGCCGACTESPCMMTTFALLLSMVVLAQVGLAVSVFVFKGQAHDILVEGMKKGMANYEQVGMRTGYQMMVKLIDSISTIGRAVPGRD